MDQCANGVVDWDNNVEETVCLFGDSSGMSAYEELDIYNGDGQVGYVADLAPNGEVDTPGGSIWLPNVIDPQYGTAPNYQTVQFAAPAPDGQYTLNGYYQECYDSQGTDGNEYPCSWLGSSVGISVSVDLMSTASIAYPAYRVTSIVYPAPGNRSTAGYTNQLTDGATTTIGSALQSQTQKSYSFGGSFLGIGASVNLTFGISSTSGNSSTDTEQFSSAAGIAIGNNNNAPNAVDHTQDLFLIWLNPAVSILPNGSAAANYAVGSQVDASGATEEPDFVEITAATMIGTNGHSQIYPAYLIHQQDQQGHRTLPGLASICVNLIQSEYGQDACTLGDQCGCQSSDFAAIIAQDPLLAYQGIPGNPYPSTEDPLQADTDGAACANPTSASNCRYVPVPLSSGSGNQLTVHLSGPQCQNCGYPLNPIALSDQTTTTQTLAEQQSHSVGFQWKVNALGLSFSGPTQTFTWTDSESTGAINGHSNTETGMLSSGTLGCSEDDPVYEDTRFHTFVLRQFGGSNYCP